MNREFARHFFKNRPFNFQFFTAIFESKCVDIIIEIISILTKRISSKNVLIIGINRSSSTPKDRQRHE